MYRISLLVAREILIALRVLIFLNLSHHFLAAKQVPWSKARAGCSPEGSQENGPEAEKNFSASKGGGGAEVHRLLYSASRVVSTRINSWGMGVKFLRLRQKASDLSVQI
jgi:hypothetical protein